MVAALVKATFAKRGLMRFISHLDLMRLFQRASRRAGIPITVTKGFSPHLRISIQPALRLGVESASLEASFRLDGWMKPAEIKTRLQEKLPEGIEILEVSIGENA